MTNNETKFMPSQRPSARRKPPGEVTGGRNGAWKAHFEVFRAQTFPHMDAVYSDAFCLTGSLEDAADLVVETYTRAFLHYDWFQRRRVSEHTRIRSALAWLYGNMHAAYCDHALAQARLWKTPTGGRP